MKGIVLTLDAIIALLLMVSIISLLIFFRTEPSSPFYIAQQLHFLSEDSLNILSKSTLKEVVTNQTLNNLNQIGVLNESYWNDKAINVIGMLWAENNASSTLAAAKIAKDILGNILPNNIGYQVLINDYNIYDSSDDPLETSRPNYSDSTTEISSGRIASGYESNKTVSGCVAMAYLTSIKGKKDSSYVYFGGYVGEGNITTNITLPPFDNITEAYMEMNAGGNFTLYINDNPSGFYVNGSAGGGLMRADNWTVCNLTYNSSICSKFTVGNNTLKFNFTRNNSFIGGGFFRVTYNTTQLAPIKEVDKDIYWFPGISGFFNLYDSFYVPGTLTNITSYLHYFNNITLNQTNATIYLSIGNVEVFSSNETGNITKYLNFSDIWKNFGSNVSMINNVSNNTVPLRFGVEEFQLKPGVGTADAVLVTDVSGSMSDNTVDCPPNVSWEISTVSQQGNYGVQNQHINNSQLVCMYRNVTLSSAGNIYFWWQVSSQRNRDFLVYCYDQSSCSRTTYTYRISGNSVDGYASNTGYVGGWQTITRSVGVGTHEIRWCYAKDGSVSSGNDTGYVDFIIVNNTGGTVFLDDFEDGILDGWSFSSSGPQCEKLAVAKDVDKIFVDTVLNTPGDRVGLSAYSTNIRSWYGLSNNSAALKSQIDSYTANGYTCISCGIGNATKTLNQSSPDRFRGMLVMSDGLANTLINGSTYLSSQQCPDTEGYNSLAGGEATNKSCYARNLGINATFGIAFGSDADQEQMKRIACWNCTACPNVCQSGVPSDSPCWIQNITLPNGTIAKCLDVRYAKSNNVDELKKIYGTFGELFAILGFTTQKAIITGIINFNNVLYPDSYIELHYLPNIIPYEYGEVSLTRESPRLKDLTGDNISKPYKEGWFNVSDKVKVVDAKITSYSSDYWTDMLWINSSATGNWKGVYNLTSYGNDFSLLGDPFIIYIPVNDISSGNNSVRIETGISTINKTGGSPDDRVIYTIRVKGSVGYGNLNETCEGASNDAIRRLNDSIGGYVNFTTDEIAFQNNSISRVPYMWGPASVRIRVWS
jgi:hypothetical protein